MIQKFSTILSFISKNMLHKEIMTKKQIEIMPLIKSFSQDFGLVGGTAIALHNGNSKKTRNVPIFSIFFNRLKIKFFT